MTLQEIVDLTSSFTQRSVKETLTSTVKIFERIDGSNIVFTDGTSLPLSTAGWEIISATKLRGAEKIEAKRQTLMDIMNEFEGENDDKIVDGLWPDTYISEMMADSTLATLMSMMSITSFNTMYAVFSGITVNATWMTQERKDYYLSKFAEAIAIYE